jgi:hypothetical protein
LPNPAKEAFINAYNSSIYGSPWKNMKHLQTYNAHRHKSFSAKLTIITAQPPPHKIIMNT